jgi:hypothetical protein
MSPFILLLSFIWIMSVAGMGSIVVRNFPKLHRIAPQEKMPKVPGFFLSRSVNIHSILLFPLKNFSFRKFIEKLLSKLYIFVLKTENIVRTVRDRLRKRQTQRGEEDKKQNSVYWEKLKKG